MPHDANQHKVVLSAKCHCGFRLEAKKGGAVCGVPFPPEVDQVDEAFQQGKFDRRFSHPHALLVMEKQRQKLLFAESCAFGRENQVWIVFRKEDFF
jgi:hypothetical protein